jgi:methylmalonyl-CoA epimerase
MNAVLQSVGIAVRSVEAASLSYEKLGMARMGPVQESRHGFDLRWQDIGNGADVLFGLLESTREDSLVGRFLERRGEGVYLLQMVVPDLPAAVTELRERGVQLIGVDDRPLEDLELCWIHPSSAHGVLIELVPAP